MAIKRSAVFLRLPKVNEYPKTCELWDLRTSGKLYEKHNTHRATHKHWLQRLPLASGDRVHQEKQITGGWDYRLVKVALLWHIADFFFFFLLLLSFSLFMPLIWLNSLTKPGTEIRTPFFYYLLKAFITAARAALKPCLFSPCNKCL